MRSRSAAPGAVAVTGALGRLGRALISELEARRIPSIAWTRPDYDLDDPAAGARLVARDRPRLVIHCAAWTDVDGCARDPELALRRNGTAVGEMAGACLDEGADLVLISTNEVFDGRRADRQPYAEDDPVGPINAYGTSKLAGEAAATAGGPRLWIVRTAWLFGPPGNDFPNKILAAADRLGPGEALRVVDDEHGSPTYTRDLGQALLDLVNRAPPGTYHLAGAAPASRYEVAREVVGRCRPGIELTRISRSEFDRASSPPAWGALDVSRAAAFGVEMRSWRAALFEYLTDFCL